MGFEISKPINAFLVNRSSSLSTFSLGEGKVPAAIAVVIANQCAHWCGNLKDILNSYPQMGRPIKLYSILRGGENI